MIDEGWITDSKMYCCSRNRGLSDAIVSPDSELPMVVRGCKSKVLTSTSPRPARDNTGQIEDKAGRRLLQVIPMKHLVSRKVGAQPTTDNVGYFIGRDPGSRSLGVQVCLGQHIPPV